jgi:hypothetical protein
MFLVALQKNDEPVRRVLVNAATRDEANEMLSSWYRDGFRVVGRERVFTNSSLLWID